MAFMYEVRLLRRAIKDIKRLPKNYTALIGRHIASLGENPRPSDAKKLQGRKDYSLRVGIYRVLYDIDEKLRIVTIYRVKHRREAYRQ